MQSRSANRSPFLAAALAFLSFALPGQTTLAAQADEAAFASLGEQFQTSVLPLIQQFCLKCHSTAEQEGELDLERFASLDLVRQSPPAWQKVQEMLDNGEMPPEEAPQPTADERKAILDWVAGYLDAEARANAGDPGRVVLRRLSNAEYTYTLRDLTGIETLDPAREFPVDSAAGEGFTNTGNALVMSPALVTKYLDAAKEVASHAVLLPDGMRFSPHPTRRDWTDEALARIREFYRPFTDAAGGDQVNLQGITFETNQGGRLPIEAYLAATLAQRDALASGAKSIQDVAREAGLNPKYLGTLWTTLAGEAPPSPSLLLDELRAKWRTAQPADAPALAERVAAWQQSLWKFSPIGQIGREGGPKAWMEPSRPIAARQEFKLPIPEAPPGTDVVLYLAAGDAGDGSDGDIVVWEQPRLVMGGRADLLLRDVRPVAAELAARRERLVASAAQCLAAAAEASAASGDVDADVDFEGLSAKHGVDPESLAAWLDYLGISQDGPVKLGTPVPRKAESSAGYDFVKAWVGDDALTVAANSSDQHVRIPGNMKPHGVAVHPTPTLAVAVGWRSLAAATLSIEGVVQHAHPECGDGVDWAIELRRGNTRQRLAAGTTERSKEVPFGPLEGIAVLAGDVVSLVISPRANHSCDMTAIDMILRDPTHEWNLAADLSPDILAGNPHADSYGNAEVWHFFSEPVSGSTGTAIPAESILARWQSTTIADDRPKLAAELQALLQQGVEGLPADSPDAKLYRQLTSLGGPLLSAALKAIADKGVNGTDANGSAYGLDPGLFGKQPSGATLDEASLCMSAPSVLEVRLPSDLAAGAEFVAAGTLHGETGKEGSVQLQVRFGEPPPAGLSPADPMITMDGSPAAARIASAQDDFRALFPVALCYTKIVPVDEVVTLTLYYREDEHLKRLMLDEDQAARLDRLWEELEFVSHGALEIVAAFEQISEFATQDRPDLVEAFKPLRQPILDRAEAFRQRLVSAEPAQVDALLEFAGRAFRRPLSEGETQDIRAFYAELRTREFSHDEALRLALARVLIAPAFMYRIEKPGPSAEPGPISDWELASRLSYFLWSSQPDEELRQVALAGRLSEPDVLVGQTRRMLADPKTRRLAIEFACQWLHVHGFDELDEKSERHFPTFAGVKGAMYEESIRFFTDMFQNDGSILGILDADHTFLNEELANHYGIPGVTGPEWRRVDGVKQYSRGGILTLGATLAKQSGASRTSPILRGNWLCEVVLGEKLPRPPKNVPVLADEAPEGLTERQLIERHTSDAACAKCHARIDPFGFALENFDAIGRFRLKDAGGLDIDPRTTVPDGTSLDGLAGLRDYLLNTRREAFVRQFHRKLLGFALGRAVQLSDEPLLEELQAAVASGEDRFSSTVERIVLSRQFREIRGRDAAQEP